MQNLAGKLSARLFSTILYQADFTQPYWASLGKEHRVWPVLAVVADLLAQVSIGTPTWWSVAASLATPLMLWFAPRVLATAVGALMVTQALGSIALQTSLVGVNAPAFVVVSAGYLFQVVCLGALFTAVLRYLRTSKASIPA